jgi:hypothetical protein
VAEDKQLVTEVPKVDNEHVTTHDIVTPNSSVTGRQKEVPATDEFEVHKLVSQETHVESVQQLSVENNNNDS